MLESLVSAYQAHLQELAALPPPEKYVGPVTTEAQHETINALLEPVEKRGDVLLAQVAKEQGIERARLARIKTKYVTLEGSQGLTRGKIKQRPEVVVALKDGWVMAGIDSDFVGRAVVTFERDEHVISEKSRPGVSRDPEAANPHQSLCDISTMKAD